MTKLAQRLDAAVRAAVSSIAGVSVGSEADRATWTVQPATLQAQAQPTIDAFNPTDPALDDADRDAEVKVAVDQERLISAVVWTILDTYSAPATVTKYQNARSKIITVYKTQPWKP